MRLLLLFILITFLFSYSFGQASHSPDVSLTKGNLKRLFKIKPAICCPAPSPVWEACNDKEGSYYKTDTVRLFSDRYYYMSAKCCYDIEWTFQSSTTFSLTETCLCTEPPLGTGHFENFNLKIKFKKEKNTLIMSIYKKRKLKDRFALLSLEYVQLSNGDYAYKLTMLRKK